MNRKRKLRPWVKVALAFIIGVIGVSQVYKVVSSSAETTEEKEIISRDALHGVVETTDSNGHAYLTMIEEFMGVADVVVTFPQDDRYFDGDIITVIYDEEGNITNSYRTPQKEIDSLRKQHGATYRMLLEKHGRYQAE